MTKDEITAIQGRRTAAMEHAQWPSQNVFDLVVEDVPKLIAEAAYLRKTVKKLRHALQVFAEAPSGDYPHAAEVYAKTVDALDGF